MRLTLILAACLALSACGTTAGDCPPAEPRIVTQRVEIQVPTPCNPTIAAEPQYADRRADIAQLGIGEQARQWRIGREQREAYIQALTNALAACRDPTRPP